jgi:hypothetical protein
MFLHFDAAMAPTILVNVPHLLIARNFWWGRFSTE